MVGTAAPAAGYLLVEQPGGWGRQALTSSRLDPAVGAVVSRRAIQQGLRALLIRRPGRHPAPERRAWAVVSSRPGREVAWWGDFGDDDELRTLPLDGSTGTPSDDPFYLVCAHGRHDQCCAIDGRPVALALARLRPGRVWECSHVGGDRFAANVVAMPHGLYYGRVEVDRAHELVDAQERGEVVPDLLRGRATTTPAAQAAIAHVRGLVSNPAIDALSPAGTLHLGDGVFQVRLRHGTDNLMVTLRAVARPVPGLLTCHARNEAHPPTYDVLEVTEAG
jgi:hypothetical protein